MISVFVLFRNAPHLAAACLDSLRRCTPAFNAAAGGAEFVLIDDHSDDDDDDDPADPARAVLPVLQQFQAAAAGRDNVRIVRFCEHRHYAFGMAAGLSLCRRDSGHVLFISHDMILTPDCFAALMETAASHPQIGTVRPRSAHMDWARSQALAPPPPTPSGGPPRSFDEVLAFSAEVRRRFPGGQQWVDWPALIADAVLIKRQLIDRIGVFDPTFPGFMADIDYGLRAQRAGYANVIALGAWLHHAGGGTRARNEEEARELTQRLAASYARFREKWRARGLPETPMQIGQEHVMQLLSLPPLPDNAEYTAPMSGQEIERA